MSELKDSVTISIDGKEYKIVLLGTSRAFATSQELAKLSLPSLGAALDGMFQQDEWAEKQTFSEMAILLTKQLEGVDTVAVAKELLAGTTENGIAIDFENHFRGRLELLAKLLDAALRGNYGSLFMQMNLSEKLNQFMSQLQSQTEVPKEPEEQLQSKEQEKS